MLYKMASALRLLPGKHDALTQPSPLWRQTTQASLNRSCYLLPATLTFCMLLPPPLLQQPPPPLSRSCPQAYLYKSCHLTLTLTGLLHLCLILLHPASPLPNCCPSPVIAKHCMLVSLCTRHLTSPNPIPPHPTRPHNSSIRHQQMSGPGLRTRGVKENKKKDNEP